MSLMLVAIVTGKRPRHNRRHTSKSQNVAIANSASPNLYKTLLRGRMVRKKTVNPSPMGGRGSSSKSKPLRNFRCRFHTYTLANFRAVAAPIDTFVSLNPPHQNRMSARFGGGYWSANGV